ncbi:MAG: Lpg1974 family pore-forming outer membrane protein [Gemmataceae bacterium]
MVPRLVVLWSILLLTPAAPAQTSTFTPTSTAQAPPGAPAPPVPPGPPPPPPTPPAQGWTTPVSDYPPPPVCPPPGYGPPPGYVPQPGYGPPPPVVPPGQRIKPTVVTEGPFFMAEFAIGYPTFQIGVSDTPTLTDVPALSLTPVTPSSYISPTFEVGYRFATFGDYIAFNYRFINTDTNSTVVYTPPGAAYPTETHFWLNQFNLDWGLDYRRNLTALWSVGTRIGAQALNLGYSTQTQKGATSYEITSNFWGGGPHGRLDLERRFGFFPDLGIVGRADGALLIGSNHATSTVTRPAALGVPALNSSSSTTVGRGIPTLNVQAGLSYSPEDIPGFSITGGYVYEHWWSVGRMSTTEGNSFFNTGQIYSHGWFIRGQFDF